MNTNKNLITILGGGLQGVSVALALANRGYSCEIIEQKPRLLAAASYGNEGKIHLGLVYALDKTLKTGQKMLQGAYSFAPLLDKWCAPLPWAKWRSKGFLYGVMPDSLSSAEELRFYYEQLKQAKCNIRDELPVTPSYIGFEPRWFWKDSFITPMPDTKIAVPTTFIETEEVAVDTILLTKQIEKIVNAISKISVRCNSYIERCEKISDGFRIYVKEHDNSLTIDSNIVVNCTWNDRYRIDQHVGFQEQTDNFSYRVKYRVIVQPRINLANEHPVTMVQGPYGDMTPYRNGLVYLSWYPLCRTYFNSKPPSEEIYCHDGLRSIAHNTLARFEELFPMLDGAIIKSCTPCTIVARGDTDVDDPESSLHRRDDTGPIGGNGWWSVNTGKLTTAPLYGEMAASKLSEEIESS